VGRVKRETFGWGDMDADRFSNRKHHHHITTTTRTATPGEELNVHEI
jgi:hypothetical protein